MPCFRETLEFRFKIHIEDSPTKGHQNKAISVNVPMFRYIMKQPQNKLSDLKGIGVTAVKHSIVAVQRNNFKATKIPEGVFVS